MSSTTFQFRFRHAQEYDPVVVGAKQRTFGGLINFVRVLSSTTSHGLVHVDADKGMVPATATLDMSGASGQVGAKVNGVAVLVPSAGSDEATARALAGAINTASDPLISKAVTAEACGRTVVVTAREPGFAGNWVTLEGVGTGVTASGSRLSGGLATQTSYSF